MQFLSLLALAASASAATLGERAICGPYATPAQLAAARKAIVDAKIAPQTPAQFKPTGIGSEVNLIPSFNPSALVDVAYGTKAVTFGNKFSTLETTSEPTISFGPELLHDPYTTKYTIIMADPDAPDPSLPVLGNFLHLITSDAQPGCVINQLRKTVAPYMLPTPLGVASHRYTFLVYRQPAGYVPPAQLMNLPGVRNNFNVTKYASDNKLEGPVAGNYFLQGLKDVGAVGK